MDAYDKGDGAWMMMSTLLVILMVVPGLALYYAGQVRARNAVSMLMQVFTVFAVILVLWCLYGYSLAFTEGDAYIGDLSRAGLRGIRDPAAVAFQGGVAALTCCVMVGAFAERARFGAVLAFAVLWFTFAYLPLAHMVWSGWLLHKGVLDFAGGTVVHINAAMAGLVGACLLGERHGHGLQPMAPHSVAMTMVGAALLWVGWFGLNAGAALAANDTAALAFINTMLAGAAGTLAWVGAEWLAKGRPTMLGGASGAVAGLVAITPACGLVAPAAALLIGALAGIACLWGVTVLKDRLGVDDALDVFGIHGVGGMVGTMLTGVFAAPALGGQGLLSDRQVAAQALAVLVAAGWSGSVAWLAGTLVDATIGLRVDSADEHTGLDLATHGESAWHR